MKQLLYTALFLTSSFLTTTIPTAQSTPAPKLAQSGELDPLTPQQVQQTARNISVRITAENSGGSGVIIAKKGDTYLILTNAHVVKRATKIQIRASDGQKYIATPLDGGFSSKYDLALLQFTSKTKYTLANLNDGSALTPERKIYSAGFPFDSKDIRITEGEVSQLSDIPFEDGTQIGYVIDKGNKGIRQGMSGGAIFDERGVFLGINTISVAPIAPNYTYNDGSKPLAKLNAQYRKANWGIPVYNFLTTVKADILYGYENLPKVQHQVAPTGYMAKLNDKARKMTVRIENSSGNGSGVIVGREGNSYYVLTAKHVMQDEKNNTHRKFTDARIITYDRDIHSTTSTVVAEGVDLAVVKFSSSNNYPVAKLGEYSQNDNDLAFVGGFPGRENINSPLWQWQLNPGFIYDKEQGKFQTQNNQSFSNGYDLIYSSISYGGMSGGPVFDTLGNVIGVHGRAESTDTSSLGISIQTFTGLAAKLRVAPNLLNIVKNNPVELNLEDRKNVFSTMDNIPEPQVGDSGKRWLAYANQLTRIREYDKSVVAFDRAISKGEVLLGNNGKSWSLRGIQKYQLAEIAIAKAIAVVPASERAKYYYLWKDRSIILKYLKKYDDALNSINLAISLESSDLTLLSEKGRILADLGQHKNAIAIYDLIIRKQPEAYAYNNRGTSKYEMGDKQGAIVDFDRAISLNNKYAIAYSNRGLVKSELGDRQSAMLDYDRAIFIKPRLSSAYSNRGKTRSELGDKKGAMLDYDRAINLDPNNKTAYNGRGSLKLELGSYQAAIIDYNRAIMLDPKYAYAYNNRSIVKFELGDIRGAIADCDRSIQLDSNFSEAYINRGNFKSKLGNYQTAIIDYNRAIVLNPKYALAYNSRGITKVAMGDKKGAILDYDRAIALNPKYSVAYNNRGVAKFDLDNGQGDGQSAILDYNRAIMLDPNYIQAYVNRGTAKSILADRQGAIIDFTKVISLNPQHAGAYGKRGVDRYNLGDKRNAIIDVSRAAELLQQQGRVDLYQKTINLLEQMRRG